MGWWVKAIKILLVCKVLVQSDVHEVALDMRNVFDACTDVFEHVDLIDPSSFSCDSDGWLQCNPMGIRTEREIHAELEGATIYRRMYQKTRHHVWYKGFGKDF